MMRPASGSTALLMECCATAIAVLDDAVDS
jgi:hypothetical protein